MKKSTILIWTVSLIAMMTDGSFVTNFIRCVEDGHEADAARGGYSSLVCDGTDFIQSLSRQDNPVTRQLVLCLGWNILLIA